MDVEVSLLGQPSLVRGGVRVAPPKGRKAWALLAYLALAERPPSRQRLAGLLFGEADDPMAALRWNLAELRRLLGDPSALLGDPIDLQLHDASIDVDVLGHGQWTDAIALDGLGHDLLEGMEFGAAPAFDAWLLTARRHLRALASSMLYEAGLALVAAGEHAAAIDVSLRLVELDPFDENAQTLLVRSLAASGDRAGAQERVRVCTDLFRRELGIEPTAGLRLAAEVSPGTSTVAPFGGRPAVRAQLEAGDAAIAAGAVEAGLQCLRRAVAEAETCGDDDLLARSLFGLGSALVHAVRGRDLEGAAALHDALGVAERIGAGTIVASACRELGFVDVQQGRHERGEHWLERAETSANGDAAELARVTGIRGMALSDSARYPEAIATLQRSIELRSGCRLRPSRRHGRSPFSVGPIFSAVTTSWRWRHSTRASISCAPKVGPHSCRGRRHSAPSCNSWTATSNERRRGSITRSRSPARSTTRAGKEWQAGARV